MRAGTHGRVRILDAHSKTIIVLIVLTLLSMSTRLLPLSISTYPFNNDAITESRIAEDILASGQLDFPDEGIYANSHSTLTPSFDVLLAFVASATSSSPFSIAQAVTAFLSVITVVGIYLLAYQVTSRRIPSIAASLTLAMFGTFVYLTGSAWKESLGIALLMLFVYAYVNRSDRRMLALELLLLVALPTVHHFVAAFAYLFLAFSTLWSVVYAIKKGRLTRRHYIDSLILAVLILATYFYYESGSFERLTYLSNALLLFVFGVSFLIVFVLFALTYGTPRVLTFSLAPIPAIAVFTVFVWDYMNPVFPYAQGAPVYVAVLGVTLSTLIYVGWLGMERIVNTKSLYKTVPVALLLPILTFMIFVLISGFDLQTHQLVYRSFDFVVISLSLGISIAFVNCGAKPLKLQILTILLIAVLLASFPFAYMTRELTGVRHDTQAYEVDALDWVDSKVGDDAVVQSDERLSYIAFALYDYGKNPNLPRDLSAQVFPACNVYNLFLEEWVRTGVDSYPVGHITLDEQETTALLNSSNVLYVGGPSDNRLTVFKTTLYGSATDSH